MDGEPLAGGNVNQVVRIGGTVRRAMGAWSPSVHALLQHLHSRGFPGAPQFLGVDEAGREILTFIPGDVAGSRYPDLPRFMWSDDALGAFARLLRQYHDATQGFQPPPSSNWQLAYPDARQHEVICHNDAAWYNVVFRQGHPVALFDFDMQDRVPVCGTSPMPCTHPCRWAALPRMTPQRPLCPTLGHVTIPTARDASPYFWRPMACRRPLTCKTGSWRG